MSGCPFCAVVTGESPAFVIADTPNGVAFLDFRPVFKGHVLIVPRPHVPDLAALDHALLPGFFVFVQTLAIAVQSGLGAGGTFVALNNTVSQSVPHLHCHVVPRTKGDGLRGFFWPRTKYASDLEAVECADKIRAALPEECRGPVIGS